MEFEEYFKKMCGDPDEVSAIKFKVNGNVAPFNKKELRWLQAKLEDCIQYNNPKKPSKHMYKSMLKKVNERLELL